MCVCVSMHVFQSFKVYLCWSTGRPTTVGPGVDIATCCCYCFSRLLLHYPSTFFFFFFFLLLLLLPSSPFFFFLLLFVLLLLPSRATTTSLSNFPVLLLLPRRRKVVLCWWCWQECLSLNPSNRPFFPYCTWDFLYEAFSFRFKRVVKVWTLSCKIFTPMPH